MHTHCRTFVGCDGGRSLTRPADLLQLVGVTLGGDRYIQTLGCF
ncbi:hypothetical protein [Leptolyngbya sp. CCY15150]|nr:hypothetical protein [Leptolyngbya sp. CCY15150]